jgi:transcriptional regulator with XRE-family HTH domain
VVGTRATVDPHWWATASYNGRSIREILRTRVHPLKPEILRTRDIAGLFGFLSSRGWSRSAIAAATGLSETRVREVRQGKQQITSYEVLERIADGFNIERGLMGLAYTDHVAPSPPNAVERGHVGLKHITHAVDQKPMVLVDEGVFQFGADNRLIWLPAFYTDLTPTTNSQYAVFVAATGHPAPRHWPDGRIPEDQADHPVVNVTFHDASAYAAWAGKTIPTEAEWEKAARGMKGNVYPWGDQPTPAKCNVRETGVGHTTPVGLYRSGVSPYGVYDMSGNVWEWCRTETAPGRYVLKGSAFTSPFEMAATAATNDASAEMLDDDTGFRCVCTPESVETP